MVKKCLMFQLEYRTPHQSPWKRMWPLRGCWTHYHFSPISSCLFLLVISCHILRVLFPLLNHLSSQILGCYNTCWHLLHFSLNPQLPPPMVTVSSLHEKITISLFVSNLKLPASRTIPPLSPEHLAISLFQPNLRTPALRNIPCLLLEQLAIPPFQPNSKLPTPTIMVPLVDQPGFGQAKGLLESPLFCPNLHLPQSVGHEQVPPVPLALKLNPSWNASAAGGSAVQDVSMLLDCEAR